MRLFTCLFTFALLLSFESVAQDKATPLQDYVWNGKKTQTEKGYVVLKSGQKIEGLVTLKGSPESIETVVLKTAERSINFPPAALESFGLSRASTGGGNDASSSAGLRNTSPESMYEWVNKGEVMEKPVLVSRPRNGYVIYKSGARVEGEFKLKKVGGDLKSFEVKNDDGKSKGKIEEIKEYGYLMSAKELEKQQLISSIDAFHPGELVTKESELKGQIALVLNPDAFYAKSVVFKDAKGGLTEYMASEIKNLKMDEFGPTVHYKVIKDAIVRMDFKGEHFALYRNPFPTTVNENATALLKNVGAVGTNIAAQAVIEKDEEENDYESNIDSLLAYGTTEELMAWRDALVKLNGYSSAQEAMDKTENESLRANLNAVELALMSDEIEASEGQIMNQEWFLENLDSDEKTVLYKSAYKDQMEVVLMGCFDFISLDKKDQNLHRKWSNRLQTVAFLDRCY